MAEAETFVEAERTDKMETAAELALRGMFQLNSSRDTVIAEGKTVLCMTLQRLHDYMTNVRMKVLHLVYKHLYTTHIEPLWKAEREKGVISKRSTTYSEAIDIPFDDFRAKCYDFLQSSDPFESDDAQGLGTYAWLAEDPFAFVDFLDDEGAAWDVSSGEAALRAFAQRVVERRHHDH